MDNFPNKTAVPEQRDAVAPVETHTPTRPLPVDPDAQQRLDEWLAKTAAFSAVSGERIDKQ